MDQEEWKFGRMCYGTGGNSPGLVSCGTQRGETAGLQARGTHGQGFGRGNKIGDSLGAAAGTNDKIR
jgi:hypothetical protein